jgi:hypothetical protein
MNSMATKKIDEGAHFIVDPLGYCNQITMFDRTGAMQTISPIPTPEPPEPIVVEQEQG